MSDLRVGALDAARRSLFEASAQLATAGRTLTQYGRQEDSTDEAGRAAWILSRRAEVLKTVVRDAHETALAAEREGDPS
jgi:hypothetical protein